MYLKKIVNGLSFKDKIQVHKECTIFRNNHIFNEDALTLKLTKEIFNKTRPMFEEIETLHCEVLIKIVEYFLSKEESKE